MYNQFGQWFPDFPGQQPYQDPAYLRNLTQAQQAMQQNQQAGQQAVQPQQQTGGFVRVQNENAARMYPVAPGNSVTFIDDNAPYCYVKTMGASQLETPTFVRYRLVREEDPPAQPVAAPTPAQAYATKADIDAIRNDMTLLKAQIDAVAYQPASATPGGDDNGQPSPEWH